MKLVEDHLGIVTILPDSRLIGLAHVHACLRDACRCPLCFSNASTNFSHVSLVLAFRGKKYPFEHQVGEHSMSILVELNCYGQTPDTYSLALFGKTD
jgi:hypothetical protein